MSDDVRAKLGATSLAMASHSEEVIDSSSVTCMRSWSGAENAEGTGKSEARKASRISLLAVSGNASGSIGQYTT